MSLEIYTKYTNNLNEHNTNKNGTNKAHSLTGVKLEKTFQAATEAIQNLPKNGSFQPSNELLLKFYAYFKQATIGPCNIPRPSIFKVVERAKWDSWNSVKNLAKEEAMNLYVNEIKNVILFIF
jgi:acyl-CoA-binding protein